MEETHTPNPWIEERKKHDPRFAKGNEGFNEKLAVLITRYFGSMGAFYLLVFWNFAWVLLAVAGIGFFAKDPYPFTFLLFLSNLVQLFALPILAVGQQVLSRASEKQAAQTFRDAETILKLEDEVHKLIKINNRMTEEIHAVVQAQARQ